MAKCDGVITRVASLSGIFLTLMFFALLQKDQFMECEVWWKAFSNKIIVTLVTQGLLSSLALVLLYKFANIANYDSSCPMELNVNKEIT